MTRAYDCGIETNHDAWRAVHAGTEDGLSKLEISERTGLSYQMVGVYLRQAAPASTRRRLNCNHEGTKRCGCGRAMTAYSDRCMRCQRIREKAAAGMPGRVEMLRSWALRHGHVPPIGTATELLGCARSTAGEVMIEAFGPDHRIGNQRKQRYRGWPEGAPDVEIEQVAS